MAVEDTGDGIVECARAVMDATPPVLWFMRREMRRRRGSLSLARFRTLVRVNQGEAGVSAIAEHLGVSVPTASRLVSGLVRGGLVARRGPAGGSDRRRVGLHVTAKGRAALDAARAGTLDRLSAELAHLSAAERATIGSAMQLLRGVFVPLTAPAPIAGAEETKKAKHVKPSKRRAGELTLMKTEASDDR